MACGSRNLYFLSGLKTSVLSHRETCRGCKSTFSILCVTHFLISHSESPSSQKSFFFCWVAERGFLGGFFCGVTLLSIRVKG
jgi:hypothetical protein